MITKAETAQLLVVITALDRRTTGDTDVEAWHLILGDLDDVTIADCAQAVRDHYRERRDWLMPADVVTRATMHARRRAGQQRAAELEAQRQAEEEADRLALDTTPTISREEIASRLKALATRGHNAIPREDPRPADVRRQEARRELATLAQSVAVANPEQLNVHGSEQDEETQK